MTNKEQRINEAQEILQLLNFDRERCNERSALVLLALLDLPPDRQWSKASNPMLRTVEIMEWLRTHYHKDYKPNTRETVRRFTLHQHAATALIVQNPDEPNRPTNSPKWCYQISPDALQVFQTNGLPEFSEVMMNYLDKIPGLKAKYDRIRDHHRIPVTLPDGSLVALSPGGQNVLLKQIVENFCGIFTPGGQVLYIGDADDKWMAFQKDQLGTLGVSVDSHGKMPDLVVYLPKRNWLVLMETATSHGPVDAKRRDELQNLFQLSTAGLVYVSCFPSRDEMRKYLHQIAWETEVWCADNPTHLIHFNGERFLGPYEI